MSGWPARPVNGLCFRPLREFLLSLAMADKGKARDALAAYDQTAEVINLDAVRDALDLCYRVWRLASGERQRVRGCGPRH